MSAYSIGGRMSTLEEMISRMPDSISKRGSYSIEAEIGRGTSGVVYSGMKAGSSLPVAIKVTPLEHAGYAEVLTLARLQNKEEVESKEKQYVPKLYEPINGPYMRDKRGNDLFIVMERLGPSLVEFIPEEGKPLSQALLNRIAVELIKALQYFHTRDHIHRDIKPANICFRKGSSPGEVPDSEVELCLIDLSSTCYASVEIQGSGANATGTPRYMSIRGHQGHRQCYQDELESLGYILYELAGFSLPWSKLEEEEAIVTSKRGFIQSTLKLTGLAGVPVGDIANFFKFISDSRRAHVIPYTKLIRIEVATNGYTSRYLDMLDELHNVTSVPYESLTSIFQE